MPHTVRLLHLCQEFGEHDGRCDTCGTQTVLVTADSWRTHPEEESQQDFVEPHGEVSGNYCPECHALTAVFLHGL